MRCNPLPSLGWGEPAITAIELADSINESEDIGLDQEKG